MAYENFIPTVWAEAINRELEKALVYAEGCNRQYDGEVKAMGDTVRILGVGRPTITTTTDKAITLSAPESVEDSSVTLAVRQICALPGFVDSKNEEKTERNAGYLVVSQSGGGMLRQGTREGIRRTPANRGMRAHRIVKGLDISEDVCHGMCP